MSAKGLVSICLAAGLLAAACGGDDSPLERGETATGGVASPTASPMSTETQAPDHGATDAELTTEVLFVGVDEEFYAMRFAAAVRNPARRALESVALRWDAFDDGGALVGSFSSSVPLIPAGESLMYVGGAGSGNLTGQPVSVKLTVEKPGRLTDRQPVPLDVSEVEISPSAYGPNHWTVSFLLTTGSEEVARDSLYSAVVLKSAAGEVVGADWVWAEAGPDTVPPGTKIRLQAEYVAATAQPDTVEAFAYVWPQ